MPFPFLETEVRKLYKLLGFNSERLAEVRCVDIVGKSGVVSREYIGDENSFVQWARKFNGCGNCFVGRNPRTKDGQVNGIHAISLDIDPIREKGVAATPQQTQEAINAGHHILGLFGGGSLGCSGNGCLVIYRNSYGIRDGFKEFEQKLRLFQEECQKHVGNGKVKIDATQDSPRLLKLLGTVSVKGGIVPTRFLRLASGAGDGDGVFKHVISLTSIEPVAKEVLLSKSNSDDRSRNDYALASHYQKQGLGPYDILEALSHHALGRPDRRDDHIRIVEKICGARWDGKNFLAGGGTPSVPVTRIYSPSSDIGDYMDGLKKRGLNAKPELPTGFREFDGATHGLRRGELYTVAARPGIGKTSLLINIALNLCPNGSRVLFLSTEMPYQAIWDRAISIGAEVDGGGFRSGTFNIDELRRIQDYGNKVFQGFNFQICDSFQPNIHALEQMVAEHKPDVLIFDHIQHIEGGEDWKAISAFTQGLKKIAMTNNIAVLVASQLRRPAQSINMKTGAVTMARPTMSDLKGCGRIEEESAFVVLLYPTGNSLAEDEPIIRADLVKNRYGPNVVADLVFVKKMTKFKSLEEPNESVN